tara:strand:+ start:7309 stop:7488 length:180 start_codon:yes stop_codon:yes gene_type:complete
MKKLQYEDIEIQVSTFEGIPVMETIKAEDQKNFVEDGYGTIADLVSFTYSSYRDWQADC